MYSGSGLCQDTTAVEAVVELDVGADGVQPDRVAEVA